MSRVFALASSQYLEVASTPVSALPLTLAAWINPSALSSWKGFLGVFELANNYNGYFIGAYGTGAIAAHVYADSAARATSAAMSTGTWYHVAGTFSAINNRSVFLNGTETAETTSRTAVTPTGIVAGAVSGNSTHKFFWDGSVAEAAMWDTVLSAAEIAQLALGFSPLFVKPASLVSYWSLIQSEDQDRVGGYHLADYGTPTVAVHPRVIYRPAPLGIRKISAPPGGLSIPVAMYHLRQQGIG
jgi:hypothetical protein